VFKFVSPTAAGLIFAACLTTACSSDPATNGGPGGGGGGRGGGRGGGGDVPVVTGKVTQKDIPIQLDAIGNVEAYTTISVRSQVTGILTEVLFSEGDFVKKGDHLFTIDPRPYQEALKQAQANLVRDKALLAQAVAQLARDAATAEYAQVTAERQAQLVARQLISKDQAQQVQSSADAAKAAADADKAAIESAQSQIDVQASLVDAAKVQLDYCTITSPLDGRTSSLEVKLGNLVTANSMELMTVAKIQPVFVTFAVPAVHLPEIQKHMAEGALTAVATPQDSTAQPSTGHLAIVDNMVDPSTDTIKLKAIFDNPTRQLWPGQFARITLRLSTIDHATVVPTEAVQTGQDGQFVFVVKPDFTVELRTVTIGENSDEDTVVRQGLQLGETVVTEGQLRLEPGTRITTADGRSVGGNAGRARGGRGPGQGPGQGQERGGGQRGQ
jgi:multidrug efflux system membrane fusion protein